MRVAIYFTPPADAPLTEAASLWLGRDAFTGAETRAPDPDLDPIVAEPARYGFHATMRAPFRLRDGVTVGEAESVLEAFARSRAAFALPRIRLVRLGRFFALVPAEPAARLGELEGAVLEHFEALRAPLSEAERARRRPETLGERQRVHLDRWGYPFVREDFRFHMTLTGPVEEARAAGIEAVLRQRFAAFEDAALSIDGLALFVEPEPGAPFIVRARTPFSA